MKCQQIRRRAGTPRRTQSLEIHTDETQTNTPQNTVETISSGEVCTVWERYRQTADIFHMISGLREQKNFTVAPLSCSYYRNLSEL